MSTSELIGGMASQKPDLSQITESVENTFISYASWLTKFSGSCILLQTFTDIYRHLRTVVK